MSLIAAVALSGMAAQDGGSPQRRVPHIVSAEETLRLADTNGDGRISREEWRANAWQVHLEQWGGGVGDRIPDENIVAAFCPLKDERCIYGARLFVLIIDRNHDGFVDRRESDLNADNLFNANDLNHDGFVTVDEMQAVASRPVRR